MTTSISAEDYNRQFGGKRGNKYGAVRTEVDGIVFDSKAEARRYGDLKLMEQAGEIRELVLQPRYDLTVQGVTIGKYIADFAYIDNKTGARIVEDVKGVKTPLYRWKKRHVKAQYGIDVREIEA
jgi:hypothetical protein